MKRRSFLLVVTGLLAAHLAAGQTTTTPFVAVWNFDNQTPAGASTKPGLVDASSLATVGVNIPSIPGVGYPASPAPGSGQHANVQNWSTAASSCNGSEYVEFSVTPQIGAVDQAGNVVKSIDITEVSFLVSSSGSGPRSLLVTSSLNGFNVTAPLFQTTLTQSDTPFGWVPVSISPGAAFRNLTTTVTFRIVACQASASGGTLRLDNLVVNGDIMLPADVIAFTARAQGQHVRLDWATGRERNTDRFVVEVSTDLLTFRRVGEVAAIGTSDQRQPYTLTHETPAPGPNYYRLLQLDRDGSVHLSRVIAAVVQPVDPIVTVMPNPADRHRITLRLPTTDVPTLLMLDALGRAVTGHVQIQSGSDAVFVPDRPLASGHYRLLLTTTTGRSAVSVLVP